MTRSQRLATAAAAVVALGVGAALVTRWVAGPLGGPERVPAEARALPGDGLLVAGVEVDALRRAGLLEKLMQLLPETAGALAGDGGEPLEGVERLFYAVARRPTAPGVGVMLGSFEPTALLVRLREAGATESEGGLRMELGSRSLALQPMPRGLLFGGVDEVAQTRAAIEAGRTRLDLEHLEVTLAALPRSAAAWGVLGAEALTSASALAAGSRLPLPPLPPLRGAGLALQVEAMPTLDVVVLAEDEEGARRFAETAAGAIAVAQMTAAPEWRELLSELALGREESTVRLRLRIPTDRLEALADRLRPES